MNEKRLMLRNKRRCPMFGLVVGKHYDYHPSLIEVRGIRTVWCPGKRPAGSFKTANILAIVGALGSRI